MSNKRRQELYERIRGSSKEEVILEEMKRLGFWPREDGMPAQAEADIKRRGELRKRLGELSRRNSQLKNTDAMLKEARNKRLKESREKRKATKERRLEEKKQRAIAWVENLNQSIPFLGKGVSQDLNKFDSNIEKLNKQGLPSFPDMSALAAAMNITVNELRFLAYTRAASKQSHYQQFDIPKKTGGVRHISAPMPRLKRCQEWILHNVLEQVPLHQAAHGFRLGRSIVTNAEPHVGQDVVINMDLKDFFPTVDYPRVKGLFRSLGYAPAIASVFALLCTEHKIVEAELDGESYFIRTEQRVLPQGAPSSPAITNAICRALDTRLANLAKSLGFNYSRYADDLSFSASGEHKEHVGKILRRAAYIIVDEGFHIHPDKTRVLRKGQCQEVTGLVVNEGLSISRKTLKNFKATLFQIEKDGPAGKKWGNSPHVLAAIKGYAHFVSMVHPEKGAAFTKRVNAIWEKYYRGNINYEQRNSWSGDIAAPRVAAVEAAKRIEIDHEREKAQAKQKAEEAAQEQKPVEERQANTNAPQAAQIDQRPVEERRRRQAPKKPWWKFW